MTTKSVLITGCSEGGMGSALAEAFHKRGLHVFATARSLSKLSHLAPLSNITLLSLDISAPASVAAAVEAVAAKTGGSLDYLVNNSGVGYFAPLLDSDVEEGKKMFDVNFWGVLRMTQAFSPLLIAAQGTVINNSSISSVLYPPWIGVYAASKAAINSLSSTLRLEMAPFNVKVVVIMTGAVDTNFYANAGNNDFKLPLTSQYLPMEETVRKYAKGEDHTGISTSQYAQKVVGDILGGAKGRIWSGGLVGLVRYVVPFMPTWLYDQSLSKQNGLDVFAKRVNSKKLESR